MYMHVLYVITTIWANACIFELRYIHVHVYTVDRGRLSTIFSNENR